MTNPREHLLRLAIITICVLVTSSCTTKSEVLLSKLHEKPQEVFDAGLALYEKKDYRKALSLWIPLAEQGHAESAFQIADMYDFALGLPHDHEQATYWYLIAAERGHGEAQCRIGGRFDDGLGVPLDYLEAYKWYWLCLRNRTASITAKYWADITLRTYYSVGILTIKQIQYAEQQANAWQLKPGLR